MSNGGCNECSGDSVIPKIIHFLLKFKFKYKCKRGEITHHNHYEIFYACALNPVYWKENISVGERKFSILIDNNEQLDKFSD